MTDIAKRVYDHAWRIDPIIRSLTDDDFYKLSMGQMVFAGPYADADVEFRLINRTKSVRLADVINIDELRAQLDHARTLRLTRGESTWLRGNMFYGRRQMFSPEYMEFLENLELPPYELKTSDDGNFSLSFKGPWASVMHWEIPALAIISELRSRAAMKRMGKFELDVLYARAKARIWEKIQRLGKLDGLKIADFGSRRRHGFIWQDWIVQAMTEGLGDKFLGTSNCRIAMERDVEPIGSSAHEIVMTYAALAESDAELLQAPYRTCKDWQQLYGDNMRIMLTDTYGTKSFLNDGTPDFLADWKGVRIDSGDNVEIGEYVLDWFKSRGRDPASKMLLFSDGLDVGDIEMLHAHFNGRCLLGFGWGTMLTNDFRGIVGNDAGADPLAPISLVCKVASVNGRPAVKLSDNAGKAMGPPDEVARYRKVFHNDGAYSAEVVV